MDTLKAEFTKLLTVRSTYILTAFVLLLTVFIAYVVFGRLQMQGMLMNPRNLYETVYGALGMYATFAAIIAILLVTHEYRYNTIMYTLTAARSRISVLLAKSIVMVTYGLVVGVFVALIAYFVSQWGLAAANKELVPQQFDAMEVLWRGAAYVSGYILFGIILGALIRGVVGAIVVFFVGPIIEELLKLVLEENGKYLPFQAIEQIFISTQLGVNASAPLSSGAAAALTGVYIAVFGMLAMILFVKRDAN